MVFILELSFKNCLLSVIVSVFSGIVTMALFLKQVGSENLDP